MTIEPSLDSLRDVVRWIDGTTKGIEICGDRRDQVAAACFDLGIEHQAAILLLCESRLFGSMHSMLRILIEAVVRGLWIRHCASDPDLDKYEKRGIGKPFGDLTEEIEVAVGAKTPVLSEMKKNAWSALNDFTHTGYIHVTRRHGGGRLGPNYPQEDVIRCIDAAGAYGLVASAELASMAGNTLLVEKHLMKIHEYAHGPRQPV